MSYVHYNPNPNGKSVGDCVIRAISRATGKDWGEVYTGICLLATPCAICHPQTAYGARI